MKTFTITRPGTYTMRNGATVEITHVDAKEAYSSWSRGTWNLDGTHTHSDFDIVGGAK